MGPRILWLLLPCLAAPLALGAAPGQVVLTDGTVLEGAVTVLDSGDVGLRTGDEEYRIPKRLVRSVIGAAPPPSRAPSLSRDALDLIEAAVDRLSSPDAGVRESAGRSLRAFGDRARPSLEAAARRPDLPAPARAAIHALLGRPVRATDANAPINVFRLLREPESAARLLTERLGLTGPQQDLVRALLREGSAELARAVQPPGRESIERVRSVVVRFREDLAAVLTDVQLRRFDGKRFDDAR